MANATPTPPKPEYTVVNFQDLVEGWAEAWFLQKASKKEKQLYKKGLIAKEIDWKRVQVESEAPQYDICRQHCASPLTSVLFQTTFANRTENDQTYSFRTERTTRSTCTITLENTFTQGYETSIGLKLPNEILEANAGFSREVSLSNSREQTIEEEMTWCVDSEVSVNKGTKAIAKLVITEDKYDGKFSFKTSIKGRIRVIFTNLKDNNSYMKSVEYQLHQIVQEAINDGRIKGSLCKVENRCIIYTTVGKCAFRYGIRQDVEVKQEKMSDTENQQDS